LPDKKKTRLMMPGFARQEKTRLMMPGFARQEKNSFDDFTTETKVHGTPNAKIDGFSFFKRPKTFRFTKESKCFEMQTRPTNSFGLPGRFP